MDLVVLMHTRLLHQGQPGDLKVIQADFRLALDDFVGDPDSDPFVITTDLGHFVQARGGGFHPLVLDEATHQFRTRVFGFAVLRLGRAWQQHARLDFDQHRRHQQVLGGKLQVALAHRLNVDKVLCRQRRHRNVEDVDVGAANQIKQQIQRAFEGVENDLQGVRRDVEIARHLRHDLAIHLGQVRLMGIESRRRRHGDAADQTRLNHLGSLRLDHG